MSTHLGEPARSQPATAQPPILVDERRSGVVPVGRLRAALTPVFLPNHYPALHGLRVVAIIFVVQLHVTLGLHGAGLIQHATTALWFGMDLFFFLSGFLIGSMLLASAGPGRRVDVWRFYVRRTFRIVPPYVVVLTVLATAFPTTAVMRANLWKEYVYLTNYIPPLPGLVVMTWGWSLALEEHFYLAVPLLVQLLRALRSIRAQLAILVLLWLSGLAMRFWWYFSSGVIWNLFTATAVFYFQTHLRYDILIAGILTACVQHYYGDTLTERFRLRSYRYPLALLSAVGFASLVFTPNLQIVSVPYNLFCWGTLTSIAYAPLVLLLLNHDNLLRRVLSLPAFKFVATFGYGIYLVHIPVIHQCIPLAISVQNRLHAPTGIVWTSMLIAALSVSTLIGYVIHVLIEKPSLLLRDRWSP